MSMLATIVLAPLAAALLIPLLRRLPAAVAIGGATVSLLASLSLVASAYDDVYPALVLPGLPEMPLRLVSAPISALLSAMVAVVASFVLVYAVGYMKKDSGKPRFFATMSFFIAAMQILVLAGDWISLLAAWELIGLASYLLIGFWYTRREASTAAMRAFLYTRTADLGLYAAVFVLIASSGSSEIPVSLDIRGTPALAASLLLLAAAMGKSAQVPLQSWLMGAMAGPTPVSALLHSATLVAAGAILLIRAAPMLPPEALLATGLVGGITTLTAGLTALGARDLKRLLAGSTSSQYGLMLIAIGAGAPLAALVHLLAHAAIKSSLFLGAGVFQHSRATTELDRLCGAGREQPRTFTGFAVAALALTGIPPLSGFFSKDALIAAALASDHALLLGAFALGGTLLTGAYMARALRILWREQRPARHVTGLAWMGAGLAALVSLALVLGLAFPAVEALVEGSLPKSAVAQAAGLVAALAGLGLGWFGRGTRVPGSMRDWARDGFVIAGGMDAWVVRPSLALARCCARLERALYRAVRALARPARLLARGLEQLEARLADRVVAFGRVNEAAGRAVRRNDEQGIDGLITALVRATIALGTRVRTLQSGLIHRELALSGAGIVLVLIVVATRLLAFT